MSAHLKAVETAPRSPFEWLWREFPQLKNATCVDRMSYAGMGRHGVVRTFRLLDGTYLRIHSWGKEDDGTRGDTVETIPTDVLAIYEGTWRAMAARGRLYDPIDPEDKDEEQPHGMRFASHEYRCIAEQEIDALGYDDDACGEELH
jgi:hypothetical protein